MRIIQTESNLSKMKNKILPTCLKRNCRDSLGEFSKTSYGRFNSSTPKTIKYWVAELLLLAPYNYY